MAENSDAAGSHLEETLLKEIVSDELEAVTFVRDYVQLQFGMPPTLNVYTGLIVRTLAVATRSGDPGFANVLVSLIGMGVREVHRYPSQKIEIVFDDAVIEISLRAEDYRGPEAYEYFGKNGGLLIE